ncbi:MAG: pseudaminic acid synthase [Coprobacillus cateniformis]|uniref:pseudaminic acid synthase n=1 Tax=Longibaculum muris TaxID=1796628 RepID=UPI003AB51B73|nr:pseudaminic acid synthase [Coprobacillus cateniformis]
MSIIENINKNGVYFIAEMSANHAGKLENALKIVELAKMSGADCVKLQTYTADTMTLDSNKDYFINKGGMWDGENLYSLYKKAWTPWEWHEVIKEKCEMLGMDFLSTPFDETSVDFLEKIGIKFYKIASFELTDIPLIKLVASKQKPIIMSTGIATFEEIEEAVEACREVGNNDIYLLKCCSCYPTDFNDMNLLNIQDMKEKFHVEVGLSDHSQGSIGAVVASVLGAKIIEKHICISRDINTADSKFSMEPDEYKKMVTDVKNALKTLGTIGYNLPDNEIRQISGRRSIFASKDIEIGEKFSKDNIKIVRPAYGIKPKYFNEILGLSSPKRFEYGDPIILDGYEVGAKK